MPAVNHNSPRGTALYKLCVYNVLHLYTHVNSPLRCSASLYTSSVQYSIISTYRLHLVYCQWYGIYTCKLARLAKVVDELTQQGYWVTPRCTTGTGCVCMCRQIPEIARRKLKGFHHTSQSCKHEKSITDIPVRHRINGSRQVTLVVAFNRYKS